MKQEYKDWIEQNYPDYTSAYVQCVKATQDMQKAFPELMRVRGEFFDPYIGPRSHWWLKTTKGEIVDPTIKQFTYVGNGQYQERDESLPEPKGKCIECGEYTYEDSNFCCNACADAYMAYMNSHS